MRAASVLRTDRDPLRLRQLRALRWAFTVNPVATSLLLLAAFAGFGWLVARKLAIVARLAPENRFDRPWSRLSAVVVNGLLQRRMLARDWKPGLMHTIIFLGFLGLLLRKLQLIAIGYYEPFTYPGVFGGAFAAMKDGIEIAVLAALGYAFWRRYVRRPARLEPNREALLILSLILAIMVSDLAFDGFRFALHADSDAGIGHERSFAFAGSAIASAFATLSPAALHTGYQLAYWTQLVVVLAFLVLLPVGEHFHIVTALPVLYFHRGRPANSVPAVDLEAVYADDADAESMRIGVRSARDLTWKEGLDAFTCTECGRCKDACPTFLTGKPLSLKQVNDSVKQHLLAQRGTILAAPAAEDSLPPLVPSVIGDDTLWACTTCGYCEAACPIELEHLPKFYRMRQHRVLMDGEFPHALKAVFAAYEAQSNPWGFAADTRGDWARDLDVAIVRDAGDVARLDYLFYVGSAASFDPRGQRIARALVAIMQQAGVEFGILGARETSTGECVRRAGNELLFQETAKALAGTLRELGVTRIVACDPHAFNSLKNEYPEFGGRYEVLHHTQLIAKLLDERRLTLVPGPERVIYHEPCYLSRHNGEYEAPRRILRALVSDAPLEFALHREKAMCCGAGGGRMWLEETIGRRINVLRVEQALPLSPTTIATACPYCAVMIADGISALDRVGAIETRDIAELVAMAMQRDGTASDEAPRAG
ncbi:MAG: (Fe-S)-binding protein [Burkholderiales bacterium]|nr:(Fe-S)-binding protein [Burkholderiales bacterium]